MSSGLALSFHKKRRFRGKSLAERRGNLQNLKVEKAPQVDVAGTRCIRRL